MFGSVAVCALVAALSTGTGSVPAVSRVPSVPAVRLVPDAQPQSAASLSPDAARPRPAGLIGLYASFAALEALDIHSTLQATSNGAVEANPAMQGVVSNKASFIAVKAATATAVIWMTEKLRKKHPGLAIAMMTGLNSAMAIVVAHNYSIH